jgi:hypothetical protein
MGWLAHSGRSEYPADASAGAGEGHDRWHDIGVVQCGPALVPGSRKPALPADGCGWCNVAWQPTASSVQGVVCLHVWMQQLIG